MRRRRSFLSRLGLPVTPLSLGIARQILAGQLDPRAAWDEALGALQRLAWGEGGPVAREMARDLLGGWRIPLEQGAEAGLDRWLRAVVEQTALPLEAKLADPAAARTSDGVLRSRGRLGGRPGRAGAARRAGAGAGGGRGAERAAAGQGRGRRRPFSDSRRRSRPSRY